MSDVFGKANRGEFLKRTTQGDPLLVEPSSAYDKAAADAFFQTVLSEKMAFQGNLKINAIRDDLDQALAELNTQNDPFFSQWLDHMEGVIDLFAKVTGEDQVGFFLTTNRGCRRFHKDQVPHRLLVTYYGKGTEWIANEDANMDAYEQGGDNNEIVPDMRLIHHIQPWDIALFTGGKKGLLHRSPPMEAGEISLLMRLDTADFWPRVAKLNNAA